MGAINSIADIFQDPQFAARGSMVEVDDPVVGKLKMPAIVPRMSSGLGRVKHLAPSLGQHNDDIYGNLLGFSSEEVAALERRGRRIEADARRLCSRGGHARPEAMPVRRLGWTLPSESTSTHSP